MNKNSCPAFGVHLRSPLVHSQVSLSASEMDTPAVCQPCHLLSSHRFIIKCWESMSDFIFMSFRLVILDEFNIHSDIPLRSPDMKIYVCARGFFFFQYINLKDTFQTQIHFQNVFCKPKKKSLHFNAFSLWLFKTHPLLDTMRLATTPCHWSF